MNADQLYAHRSKAKALLLAALREKDADPREIATRCGISDVTVGRIAGGFSFPQEETADRIIEALEPKKGKVKS